MSRICMLNKGSIICIYISLSCMGGVGVVHVNVKDKEKLKNDKYSQRCRLIDSDFIGWPLKSTVLVLRNLKIS